MKNRQHILWALIVLCAVLCPLQAASDKELYDKYWAEGDKYGEVGNWKKAAESFTKAITYYPVLPANYGSYVNRANAYSMLGKLDLALKDYAKVIDSFPDKAAKELGEVYYNRGAAYDKNGKPALAIPDYERAISMFTAAWTGQPLSSDITFQWPTWFCRREGNTSDGVIARHWKR